MEVRAWGAHQMTNGQQTDLLDLTIAIARGWWLLLLLPVLAIGVSMAMSLGRPTQTVAQVTVPYGESTSLFDVPETIRREASAFGAGVFFTPTRATISIAAGDEQAARARLQELVDRLASAPVLQGEEIAAAQVALNRLRSNLDQLIITQQVMAARIAGASESDLAGIAMVNMAVQNEIARREDEIARLEWQATRFLVTDSGAEISTAPHRRSVTASLVVPAALALALAAFCLVLIDRVRRSWNDPDNSDAVSRINKALGRAARAG